MMDRNFAMNYLNERGVTIGDLLTLVGSKAENNAQLKAMSDCSLDFRSSKIVKETRDTVIFEHVFLVIGTGSAVIVTENRVTEHNHCGPAYIEDVRYVSGYFTTKRDIPDKGDVVGLPKEIVGIIGKENVGCFEHLMEKIVSPYASQSVERARFLFLLNPRKAILALEYFSEFVVDNEFRARIKSLNEAELEVVAGYLLDLIL